MQWALSAYADRVPLPSHNEAQSAPPQYPPQQPPPQMPPQLQQPPPMQQPPVQAPVYNPVVAPAAPVIPPRPQALAPVPQPQQPVAAPAATGPPPGIRFPDVNPPPPRPSAESRAESRPKRAYQLSGATQEEEEQKEEWESGWPAAAKRKRGWPNPNGAGVSRPESPAIPKGLGSAGLGPRPPSRTEPSADRPASRGPALLSRPSEPLSSAAPATSREDRRVDEKRAGTSSDAQGGRRKGFVADLGDTGEYVERSEAEARPK